MRKLAPFCAVAAAVMAALAVRVLPAWPAVFTGNGVSFQEDDALFHLRTVHNLLAHFPHRSGFDPYALFPGGQNIPTGPFWDFLIASAAWVLGFGSPSPLFIDQVAAWLPAILGALFPIPAYFLARRFFGPTAARFAVLWIALLPGAFLWLTHLGLADHHAAEAFLAFLTLALLCAAVEASGASRVGLALLAGVSMGAFLATRPAGIFVPAIIASTAAWEALLAFPALVAASTAALLFLPATGALWSEYTWLALAFAVAVPAASWGFAFLARRWNWPRVGRPVAALAILVVVAAGVAVARPGILPSLWFEVKRVAGVGTVSRIEATVTELQPIYRAGEEPGWGAVFEHLGTVWIPALPVLVWVLWRSIRTRRPALRLFAIWSLVMAIGALLQLRMVVYFAPVGAVLAGAACERLMRWKRPAYRQAAAAALVALVIAVNLPQAIRQMRVDVSPGTDWQKALLWLRRNSPEPFSSPQAWWQYHARLRRAASAPEPPRWGVAVWWDKGWAVEQIAHRVPMSNGTQAGASDLARFYIETSPEAALQWLRKAGARYVIADPTMPVWGEQNRSFFYSAAQTLGRNLKDYVRVMIQTNQGMAWSVSVYLPDYYRTMAARLYLFNGAEVRGTGPWLFETRPMTTNSGAKVEVMLWSQHFASEREAYAFMAAHPAARLTMGCLDPQVSCFAIPAVRGLRRVFTSDQQPFSSQEPPQAVKIFEVMDEQQQLALVK